MSGHGEGPGQDGSTAWPTVNGLGGLALVGRGDPADNWHPAGVLDRGGKHAVVSASLRRRGDARGNREGANECESGKTGSVRDEERAKAGGGMTGNSGQECLLRFL